MFERRIGALEGLLLDLAVGRLAGRVEDRAVDVEFPAVITATNAAILDDTVFERGAAVAAMALEKPDTAALVAEQHHILAEEAHRER